MRLVFILTTIVHGVRLTRYVGHQYAPSGFRNEPKCDKRKACLFTLIIKRDKRKPQSESSRRGKIWPGNLRLVMIQVRTPSTSDAFGKICSVSSDLHLLTYGWMKDASCGRSNAHFSTARFGGWEAFPRFAGNGLPGPHAPPLVSSLG